MGGEWGMEARSLPCGRNCVYYSFARLPVPSPQQGNVALQQVPRVLERFPKEAMTKVPFKSLLSSLRHNIKKILLKGVQLID